MILLSAATFYCLALWGNDPRGFTCPLKPDACQWFKRVEKRAGFDAKCLPIGPKEDGARR